MPSLRDYPLNFISDNPATAAYRDSMRFDLQQRQGEAGLEAQDLSNEYARGSMPSRLRTVEAGADYDRTRADVAAGKAPYDISKAGSEASLAQTNAGVARGIAPYRVSEAESGARTARAGADVAEGTVPARIAQTNAGARSATAGARSAESNANVTEQTEGTRVQSAKTGLRQQEANALNTEMQSFYKSLDLLNAGRIDEAIEVARQAGQTIEPSVILNADLRAAITNAAKNALAAYPGRPRDQQAYIKKEVDDARTRMAEGQRASDPGAPYEVPNAPPPPEQSSTGHNYQLIPGTENGVPGYYSHDTRTNERTFHPNATVTTRANVGARGIAKDPADVATAKWLLESKVAPNEEVAWKMAREGRSNPNTLYTQVYNNALRSTFGNSNKAKQIADEWLVELEKRNKASSSQPAHVGPGTAQNPHRPQTQADFDALPAGSVFINPSDGKPYRKN